MKMIKAQLTTLTAFLVSATPLVCVAATTGNATPSIYKIRIQQVEFHKVGDPTDQYTTFAAGSGLYDIASVSPGRPCGTLAKTGILSPGSYDKMRFTVSKTMYLKGASNGNLSNGKPCRTTSASTLVSNPFGDGSVNSAYLGSIDGGTPQLATTAVPSGSSITLPSGFVDQGSSFQGTVNVNFTIVQGQSVPNIKVAFDVTNAIDFEPVNSSTCVVFPAPPSVTIVNT